MKNLKMFATVNVLLTLSLCSPMYGMEQNNRAAKFLKEIASPEFVQGAKTFTDIRRMYTLVHSGLTTEIIFQDRDLIKDRFEDLKKMENKRNTSATLFDEAFWQFTKNVISHMKKTPSIAHSVRIVNSGNIDHVNYCLDPYEGCIEFISKAYTNFFDCELEENYQEIMEKALHKIFHETVEKEKVSKFITKIARPEYVNKKTYQEIISLYKKIENKFKTHIMENLGLENLQTTKGMTELMKYTNQFNEAFWAFTDNVIDKIKTTFRNEAHDKNYFFKPYETFVHNLQEIHVNAIEKRVKDNNNEDEFDCEEFNTDRMEQALSEIFDAKPSVNIEQNDQQSSEESINEFAKWKNNFSGNKQIYHRNNNMNAESEYNKLLNEAVGSETSQDTSSYDNSSCSN